ncbi:M12 family metallo-peptidase [Streptomyces sp. NPDC059009]|uniref:InlB B-repeat-containing protein n=1 Tax=Streptomyces sp. NPDC059009 TaxID=3346694 RepID=UPI0036AD5D2F
MRHLRRTALTTATVLAATVLPVLTTSAAATGTDKPLPPGLMGAGYAHLNARDFASFCDLEPDGDPRADSRTLVMDFKRLPELTETYQAKVPVQGEAQLSVDDEGLDTVYWLGERAGDPTSFVFIAVDGACTDSTADDDVTGTVESEDREYLFGSDPDNSERTEAIDFDPSKLPAPSVPPLQLPPNLEAVAKKKAKEEAREKAGEKRDPSERAQAEKGDKGGKKAVIDVVVGYTPMAKKGLLDGTNSEELANWGTAFRWTPQKIEDRIKAAELQMNRAFEKAGVNAEVRIVHSFEIKGYKGSEDPSAGQQDMENGTGELGKLAHKVRDQYNADLVSFWTNVPKSSGQYTAGQGSLPNTKVSSTTDKWAYSTIDVFTATGRDPGFAHELGHNLALYHDPITFEKQLQQAAQANNMPVDVLRQALKPPYKGSQGWITPDGKWFTTMAYRITCQEKFGHSDKLCKYAGTYSNPKVSAAALQKLQLGTGSDSNAAAVLRQTAPVVAAYRTSSVAPLATRIVPSAKAGKVSAKPAPPYTKGTRVTLTAAPAKYWKLRSWLVGRAKQAAKGNGVTVTLPDGGQTVTADFTCRIKGAGGALGKAWAQAKAEKGKLGCPTGAPVRAKNKDFSQRFEGGTVTWVARTGKVVVR